MPTTSDSKLPKPESWGEFEKICADLLKEIWEDPYVTRFGKQGQKQNGIDILGEPEHLEIGSSGAQCKRKNDQSITFQQVKDEVEEAESFEPRLKEFLLMTTSEKDTGVEDEVRTLSQNHQEEGSFSVRILFWEDICLELSNYPNLMKKHFPQYFENSDSLKNVLEKIMGSSLDDWKFDDEEGLYTFKPDVKLKIEREDFEEGREFEEDWLENYPDSSGRTNNHKIYYNGTLVKKIRVVGVDGFRCNIPFPEYEWNSEEQQRENLHLTKFKYKVGRILNKPHYEIDRQSRIPTRSNFERKLDRADIDYPNKIPMQYREE